MIAYAVYGARRLQEKGVSCEDYVEDARASSGFGLGLGQVFCRADISQRWLYVVVTCTGRYSARVPGYIRAIAPVYIMSLAPGGTVPVSQVTSGQLPQFTSCHLHRAVQCPCPRLHQGNCPSLHHVTCTGRYSARVPVYIRSDGTVPVCQVTSGQTAQCPCPSLHHVTCPRRYSAGVPVYIRSLAPGYIRSLAPGYIRAIEVSCEDHVTCFFPIFGNFAERFLEFCNVWHVAVGHVECPNE